MCQWVKNGRARHIRLPKKEIQHVSGIISLKNINELTNIIKNQDISFLSLDIDSYDFFIMLEIDELIYN